MNILLAQMKIKQNKTNKETRKSAVLLQMERQVRDSERIKEPDLSQIGH